jgi:hypothetical protein
MNLRDLPRLALWAIVIGAVVAVFVVGFAAVAALF